MASEGTTTSPPAVTGSSFSIENLLNLSDGSTETRTAKISTGSLLCDSLSRPSLPLVPRAVRPFVYHGQNVPLCTPDSGFHFAEMSHLRPETCIHHFPIPNNGPPLGKLKVGIHWLNSCPCYHCSCGAENVVITPLHFILHHVNR